MSKSKISTIFFLYVSLLTSIFSLAFYGCMDSQASQKKITVDIPTLLPRNEALGSPEEQEAVLNEYTRLSNAIWSDEKDVNAYLRLARLYMQEARVTGEHGHYYPASLEVITKALNNEPTDDERFVGKLFEASVLLSLHQFEAAKQAALEASVLNPQNAQVYGALVDANVELGNYDEAVAMADKMVSLRPDLRSYSRISYLREIYGDVEGAMEAMQMAITAGYPGFEETTWCQLTLGNLFLSYGDTANARIQYESALKQRENYPFAIAALAELEMRQKNYTKAEELLKKACRIIPEVSFYQQLASLYQMTDRKAEANQLIDEIFLMLADDEANGHQMGMEYADIYLNLLNDPANALIFAMKEYKARPDNIDVNARLAAIYIAMGENEIAKEYLHAAARTGSQSPELARIMDNPAQK